jgi:hypothetical protein
VAQERRIMEREEDVEWHRAGVLGRKTLEVTVVAGALEGLVSAVVVSTVMVDTRNALVDFERHDIVFVYLRCVSSPTQSKRRCGTVTTRVSRCHL